MLFELLILMIAVAIVISLSLMAFRANRSKKSRALTSLMLDPFSLNQISNPIKREAAAHIEQMETGHDKEDEGQGDAPPEAAEGDSIEQALDRQMRSSEAYLRRRGARGTKPDNGARV